MSIADICSIAGVVISAVSLWQIRVVHKLTNSMSERLQAEAKAAGRAEGKEEQKEKGTG